MVRGCVTRMERSQKLIWEIDMGKEGWKETGTA